MDYVKQNRGEAGIIYAATRKDVDQLQEHLEKAGHCCGKIPCGHERRRAGEAAGSLFFTG
ncbi:hypothetical protein GCM10020331_061350 [Ectobacillus funiculus]